MLEKLRDFIRPMTVAALITTLLVGAVIAGALEAAFPTVGVAFTNGVAGWFSAIPTEFYQLATVGLLGYTASRTVEKAVKSHSGAKYNSRVDDPE